jgi:cyclic pyranopterin monophosphate synthase
MFHASAAGNNAAGAGDDDDPAAQLTHLHKSASSSAYTPRMVDVGEKQPSRRTAHARSHIRLPAEVARAIVPADGSRADVVGPKGAVFTTAIIAGVTGAKKTSELIPFCHPIGLDVCDVSIALVDGGDGARVRVDCEVAVTGKTGVEMEALTGCSVAALCVYDMLKALSHDIVVEETKLMSKTGGKRHFERPQFEAGEQA